METTGQRGGRRVLLEGPHGAGKFALANALASEHGAAAAGRRRARLRVGSRRVADTDAARGSRCHVVSTRWSIFTAAATGAARPQLLRAFTEALSTLPAPHALPSVELPLPVVIGPRRHDRDR